MRKHHSFILAMFLFLVHAVSSSQQITNHDLAVLLSCVRTSSHDMLGPEFASGKEVHLRYVSSRRDARRGEQLFYLAVITQNFSFGRIFRVSKSQGQWWVNNDANFETRPKWQLTSDPLGGVSSTSFMESALVTIEGASDHTLHLGPPTEQPKQCTTYVQYFNHTK
jgi:hypothetical protein